MSTTPLIDIYHAVMFERHRQNFPKATWVYMHPLDALDLEGEVMTTEHLRYTTQRDPRGGLSLFGPTIRPQPGIREGWMVIEAERGRHDTIMSMHELRCFDHEDCRASLPLARSCLAARMKVRPTEIRSVATKEG